MATTITHELHEELLKLVRQEIERQAKARRENRSVYHLILKDFADEMKRYNKHTEHLVRRDGTSFDTKLDSETYALKIKDGIGALLRSMYHADCITHLPASAEPEMRRFVRGVLDLMQETCPPEK